MKKKSTVIKVISSALIIALGLVVIILGKSNDYTFFCRSVYTSDQTYGGDAYTGIQNAVADVSYNVSEIGEALQDYSENVQPIVATLGGILIMLVGTYLLGSSIAGIEKEKTVVTAPDTAANAAPAAPVTNKSNEDTILMLSKYKSLLDSGALTQEEFDEKKKQLLES